MIYDDLLDESADEGISVAERHQFKSSKIKGLYSDRHIFLSYDLWTDKERAGVLAEELGHHYLTAGDILDQSKTGNRKQENIARGWAYNRTIGIEGLIYAYNAGCETDKEYADFFGVTVGFLKSAMKYYESKYAPEMRHGENNVKFSPFRVDRRMRAD